MKIIKKITAVFLILFFTSFNQLSFAQTRFNFQNNAFNISLPPVYDHPVTMFPYYTLFVETGNGRYFKIPNAGYGIVNGSVATNNSYPYPYLINNNSTALASVSGWYDTTVRPPRALASLAGNPSGNPLPDQNLLPPPAFNKPQKRIVVDPCVNIVLPGDTMAVAITYKPYYSVGSKNIVAFFYNASEGGNFFSPVDGTTTYSFYGNNSINAIRVNNETVYTSASDIPGIAQTIIDKLNSDGAGYTNKLFFTVPPLTSINDEKERNLFLSLAPSKNHKAYLPALSSGFKATITHYKNSEILPGDLAHAPLTVNFDSRDPNGITTSPHCFEGSEGFIDPHNTTIRNNIRFENEGPGVAKDIEITVTIPKGLDFPASLAGAYVNVKNMTRFFTPCTPFIPCSRGEKYCYRIEGRKIIFILKDVKLNGKINEREPAKRSGIISFVLKTNPAPLKVPYCMYTYVSIVFINSDCSRNKAVKGKDLIRTNCLSETPCSEYSVDPKTKQY